MRVGQVVKLIHERKFGFIRADNFRNDIFFHYSTVVGPSKPDRWEVGQEVEFDLNELHRMEHGELEAAKVQVASRPLSHILDEKSHPGLTPAHHPKARRKKPRWRSGDDEPSVEPNAPSDD